MATDDFEVWKICWEVNMLFHTPNLRGRYKCVFCKKEEESDRPSGSDFALVAARCDANHDPGAFEEGRRIGVCPLCEVDLLQNIAERKQVCFKDGCRRLMTVNKYRVKQRLGQKEITEQYLVLVHKYRFFKCNTCFCEISLDDPDEWVRAPTSKCEHDPTTCRDCLVMYIENAVRSNQWHSIKCPDEICGEKLDGRDVHEFAPPEVFRQYDENITRTNLSKKPNFRWCHFQACGNGQIVNNRGARREWRCTKCARLNCFDCKDEGHPGETCVQHAQLKPHRANNENEIRRISKKCPKKNCGRRINKVAGCIHMYCDPRYDGCGIKFCWKCKVIFPKNAGQENSTWYSSWEYKHIDGCKFIGGRYDSASKQPRPRQGDPNYRDDWDQDPGYEEGNSDSEQWL
ncbi:hypothetical protein GQ44DRAFT_778387 [Phaeosphaeriaceae sp. PMI808]|nr:hypothetical protein GQ44DRAFT_778387 [Phaeosphaeriaceae sp. PMI808]